MSLCIFCVAVVLRLACFSFSQRRQIFWDNCYIDSVAVAKEAKDNKL